MQLLRTAAAVVDLAGAHDGPRPNVDFALAVFEEAFDMPDSAGEAIFGIARTAGLIAHAIEEYQHQLRFRPRASYTGAPILKPGSTDFGGVV
jgi:citrate synthase